MRPLAFWFIPVLVLSAGSARSAEPPPAGRMRRADAFFGLHFDFHAGTDCTEIGKTLDRGQIEEMLDAARPDYVQCDSKGHAGYSSYPTVVGNPAPGFARDPLKIWREATAGRNVPLFVHHSGVWDARAVALHPGWAVRGAGGVVDDRKTSVFGPYPDSLLVPQLIEMSDRYGVDGAWVDGECWAHVRDWGARAADLFKARTGMDKPPVKPGDPGWYAFSEFSREGFRESLRRTVDAVHRHNPGFQITSNWAFSSMMPEPVSAGVDWLSGDFSAKNSVNSARLEGRCLALQGKPWDLMAWSFTWTDDSQFSTKSAVQLCREASVVLSLGGGFQAYFTQRRDASIKRWQIPLMAEVARFCRARQEWCHRAEAVPQVGLVYSGKAFYRKVVNLFAAWNGELLPMQGVLQCLLDGQNVVDIVMEHQLEGRMRDYPLLVYPEWETVEPEFKSELLRYVEDGGSLLLIGPGSAALFADELDVVFEGAAENGLRGLAHGNRMAGVRSVFQKVRPGPTARPYGLVYGDNDFTGVPSPAATITPLGRGRIAAVYLGLGESYLKAAAPVVRDFLSDLGRELYPDRSATVRGSHSVDVTLNRMDGRTLLHLVNTSGPHADANVQVFDELPRLGPLAVEMASAAKPRKVTIQPGDVSVPWAWEGGRVRLTVPELEIYSIVVVEN